MGPFNETVSERQKDGRAELRCVVPDKARCIAWMMENPKLFPFLRSSECTDGSFLIELQDGTFEAHVIECKLTINQDSRNKAKAQMAWTLVRLHALAGALGIQLARAVLYTAYCNDQLSKDPGLLKVPLGAIDALTAEDEEVVDALEGQFDWPEQEISLSGFEERFPHRAVKLSAASAGGVAEGCCVLASP
ncbi:hypothetical protein [Sorangium sp. So ce204]|uniref:hypothetical protein n=1 Tax=Sorangium sp. So ce204 TaxID=3133288 RepID=UPI003F60C99A